jgi:hypothetical protein
LKERANNSRPTATYGRGRVVHDGIYKPDFTRGVVLPFERGAETAPA